MFAFSDDFGSLKALAIPPRPKGDQGSHDCEEIVRDRHRNQARRNANMKAKKGPRDADQGRREVAGACPKPAAPIASNGQPGNDADECHNDEDLQGSGHSGLSVAMRLASRSGACGEACTDSQGYNKQKPAWSM